MMLHFDNIQFLGESSACSLLAHFSINRQHFAILYPIGWWNVSPIKLFYGPVTYLAVVSVRNRWFYFSRQDCYFATMLSNDCLSLFSFPSYHSVGLHKVCNLHEVFKLGWFEYWTKNIFLLTSLLTTILYIYIDHDSVPMYNVHYIHRFIKV